MLNIQARTTELLRQATRMDAMTNVILSRTLNEWATQRPDTNRQRAVLAVALLVGLQLMWNFVKTNASQMKPRGVGSWHLLFVENSATNTYDTLWNINQTKLTCGTSWLGYFQCELGLAVGSWQNGHWIQALQKILLRLIHCVLTKQSVRVWWFFWNFQIFILHIFFFQYSRDTCACAMYMKFH